MTTRTIKFTSIYWENDECDEVERVETVELPDNLAEMTEDERAECFEEILWPLTGTGRESSRHAGYFAESIDGIDPIINVEWC